MKNLFILLAAFAACSGAFANDTIRFTWEAGTTEKFIGLGGYGGDFTIIQIRLPAL